MEKFERTPEEAGYVYILSNAAMNTPAGEPIFKIGKSKRGGACRAKEGDKETFQAEPFKLEFEAYVADHHESERLVHELLAAYRISPDREFFRCSLSQAISAICHIANGGGDHVLRLKDTQAYKDYRENSHCYGGYWVDEDFFLRVLKLSLEGETPHERELMRRLEEAYSNEIGGSVSQEWCEEWGEIVDFYDPDMRIIKISHASVVIANEKFRDIEDGYKALLVKDQQLEWRRRHAEEELEEFWLEDKHCELHDEILELEARYPRLKVLRDIENKHYWA
jgi:hypothetical protein